MSKNPASSLWPRTSRDLAMRFPNDGLSADWAPVGDQADLLLELLALYRARGLAYQPGSVALCDVCPHAEPCWRSLDRSERRRPTPVWYQENGGIIMPWVGRLYGIGGVVVVGINPNIAADDYTSLLLEHGISWEHYIPTFEQGSLTEGHSSFAGCAMRTAGLVLDDLDGQPVRDRADDPRELIDIVHRTARLQAVKCVPRRARSVPSPEMTKRCPDFLLAEELAILRPSRIVTLGAPARDGGASDGRPPPATWSRSPSSAR